MDEILQIFGSSSPYAYAATSCELWPLLVAEGVSVPVGCPFVMDAFSNDQITLESLCGMVSMLPSPLPRAAIDHERVYDVYKVSVMRGEAFARLFKSTFPMPDPCYATSWDLAAAVRRGPSAVYNLAKEFPAVRGDQSVVVAAACSLSGKMIAALRSLVATDQDFWITMCTVASRQRDLDPCAFVEVMREIENFDAQFTCDILANLFAAGHSQLMQHTMDLVCERDMIVDMMAELMSREAISDASILALTYLVSTHDNLERVVYACAAHRRDVLTIAIIQYARTERGAPAFMSSPTSANNMLSSLLHNEETRRQHQGEHEGYKFWTKVAAFTSIVNSTCPSFHGTPYYGPFCVRLQSLICATNSVEAYLGFCSGAFGETIEV